MHLRPASSRSRPHAPHLFAALACLALALATIAVAQPSVPPRPGAGGYSAEGFIPIPDTNLEMYYFVVGEGDPDLVVFSSPFLDGELLPLAEERTVAFVHSRGRGNSTTVTDHASVTAETEIADIDTARAYFGLERMDLAGTSLWGAIVARYAALHPERVDRLVLLNPLPMRAYWMSQPANVPENDVSSQQALVEELQTSGANRTDAYTFCREELVVLSAVTVVDLAHLENRLSDPCQYRNEQSDVNNPLLNALFGSLGDWDWRMEVAGVQATTLVVYGSHDLAAAEAFEEYGSTIQNATMLRVEDSGHEPLLDQPEIVLDAVDAFLRGEMP